MQIRNGNLTAPLPSLGTVCKAVYKHWYNLLFTDESSRPLAFICLELYRKYKYTTKAVIPCDPLIREDFILMPDNAKPSDSGEIGIRWLEYVNWTEQ